MPPRSTAPPGKQRRRPSPVMPGGWIWVVILAMVVGMLLINSMSAGSSMQWDEFWRLMTDAKYSQHLRKLTFVGATGRPASGHISGPRWTPSNHGNDPARHTW